MTDLEISKALAMAIGWTPEQMKLTCEFGFQVAAEPVRSSWDSGPWWRGFDYRDPAVIWPIAERYNAFPFQLENGIWYAQPGFDNILECEADTASKAVALAVIAGAKK